MRFAEIRRDLFNVPLDRYKLVHCVSADFEMGKGIAVKVVEHFPDEVRKLREGILIEMRNKDWTRKDLVGKCCKVVDGHVFHLVTKLKYNDKPTYETLALSLHKLRERCLKENIGKLAMPTIGCGLDKLEWDMVRKIIQGIFSDTEIDIVICHWR